MAIIITGNPGVGKHSVAKNISKILKYKICDINKIALESGLYEKKGESNDVDVKKLKNILKNKINNKSIVVGHLAPYVVTKKQVTKVIILRKNPYHLTLVYKKRKYSTKKIAETVHADLAKGFIHAIDVKTKQRIGADHQLKNGDVIKIVSSMSRG